ncbi:hypothetical protein [Rhizobium binae]|uniref:hypothetical protein n=1 Tax=Rhizobium binae TaxID=1138190 RepID=UPI001C82C52E|nr:hypothetical protein [Rhizobium binae]MBX4926681.1 hypothetical protein [Rhizobium binae]MBX4962226.1 hypothetical protein [Rhizobium binae]
MRTGLDGCQMQLPRRRLHSGRRTTAGDVGAFVFDAAGAAVASPFRLAGRVAAAQWR